MASTTTKLLIQSLMQKKAEGNINLNGNGPVKNAGLAPTIRAQDTGLTPDIMNQLTSIPEGTPLNDAVVNGDDVRQQAINALGPEEAAKVLASTVKNPLTGNNDLAWQQGLAGQIKGQLAADPRSAGVQRAPAQLPPPPAAEGMSTGKKAAIIAAILTGAAGVGYGINKMVSKKKPAKTAEKE